MTNTNQRGFTLIELMVVVVIIAILASVSYPSYREFVRRSARSEAKTALLENAQFMERNFTASNRYDQDSAGTGIDSASLPVPQTPKEGSAKYTITLDEDALERDEFVLRATPVAGSGAADDPCGTLTLSNTGEKDVLDGSRSASECWSK